MSRFHPNTDLLIDYWRRKAGPEALPARADIGPGDFLGLLAQVLIVGREARGHYPVRLAGGFIDDLHGEKVKPRNTLLLWAMEDRTRLQTALELSRRNPHPIVAVAEARGAAGGIALVEMLFAPLAGHGGVADRWLSLYQPLTPIARLGGQPTLPLGLRALQTANGAEGPSASLRLAAVGGRRVG
jgi:hypothetical protein